MPGPIRVCPENPLAALREEIRRAGKSARRTRLSLAGAALAISLLVAAPHILAALTPQLKLYGFLPEDLPLVHVLYALPLWGLGLVGAAVWAGCALRRRQIRSLRSCLTRLRPEEQREILT